MTNFIKLHVDYEQIAIFRGDLLHPFNDWTDKHVAQGFSWRPGSVSFRTLIESGECNIEIDTVFRMSLPDVDAVRIIDVPFDVPENGEIEVASIAESVPLTLPSGSFLLRCELFAPRDSISRIRLIFAKNEPPKFEIVRADDGISIGADLLKNAKPAAS